jgi:2-amino-4-hydroxy-6-hydroxymethyldihydropteridine diphosphokinase
VALVKSAVVMPTTEHLLVPASREPVQACVALGANLGDAPRTVAIALRQLDQLPHTKLLSASGLYRTAPWQANGPDFINAVAVVSTRLTAPALLDALLQHEAQAGRERPYPNAPRTLDLDLLLYGSGRITSSRLTVPHPRMWERAFVVVPLAEVLPQQVSAAALAQVAGQVIELMPADL